MSYLVRGLVCASLLLTAPGGARQSNALENAPSPGVHLGLISRSPYCLGCMIVTAQAVEAFVAKHGHVSPLDRRAELREIVTGIKSTLKTDDVYLVMLDPTGNVMFLAIVPTVLRQQREAWLRTEPLLEYLVTIR